MSAAKEENVWISNLKIPGKKQAKESLCHNHPDYAIICSFLQRHGDILGITHVSFTDLQRYLEDTKTVAHPLIDLHIRLLRKLGKSSASHEKWERFVKNFCYAYSGVDGWEIEQLGYKNAKLGTKLRILKNLLECQFDNNTGFKNRINERPPEKLRLLPIGRDRNGLAYWYLLDKESNLLVYREEQDDVEAETWELVCSDRYQLAGLITNLQLESVSKFDLKDKTSASVSEDSNDSMYLKLPRHIQQRIKEESPDSFCGDGGIKKIDAVMSECDNVKPASESGDVKPANERADVKPASESDNVKPASESDNVKPESSTDDVKPDISETGPATVKREPINDESGVVSAKSKVDKLLEKDKNKDDNLLDKEENKDVTLLEKDQKSFDETGEIVLAGRKSDVVSLKVTVECEAEPKAGSAICNREEMQSDSVMNTSNKLDVQNEEGEDKDDDNDDRATSETAPRATASGLDKDDDDRAASDPPATQSVLDKDDDDDRATSDPPANQSVLDKDDDDDDRATSDPPATASVLECERLQGCEGDEANDEKNDDVVDKTNKILHKDNDVVSDERRLKDASLCDEPKKEKKPPDIAISLASETETLENRLAQSVSDDRKDHVDSHGVISTTPSSEHVGSDAGGTTITSSTDGVQGDVGVATITLSTDGVQHDAGGASITPSTDGVQGDAIPDDATITQSTDGVQDDAGGATITPSSEGVHGEKNVTEEMSSKLDGVSDSEIGTHTKSNTEPSCSVADGSENQEFKTPSLKSRTEPTPNEQSEETNKVRDEVCVETNKVREEEVCVETNKVRDEAVCVETNKVSDEEVCVETNKVRDEEVCVETNKGRDEEVCFETHKVTDEEVCVETNKVRDAEVCVETNKVRDAEVCVETNKVRDAEVCVETADKMIGKTTEQLCVKNESGKVDNEDPDLSCKSLECERTELPCDYSGKHETDKSFTQGQLPIATASDIKPPIVTASEVEPPIATASEVEPQITTASEVEPQITTASEVEPQIAASSEVEPQIATASEVEPHIATASEVEPQIATASEVEPHIATSEVEPQIAKGPEVEPQMETASEVQPQIATSEVEPQISTSEVEPQIATSEVEPQIATSEVEPQIATSTVESPIATASEVETQTTTASLVSPCEELISGKVKSDNHDVECAVASSDSVLHEKTDNSSSPQGSDDVDMACDGVIGANKTAIDTVLGSDKTAIDTMLDSDKTAIEATLGNNKTAIDAMLGGDKNKLVSNKSEVDEISQSVSQEDDKEVDSNNLIIDTGKGAPVKDDQKSTNLCKDVVEKTEAIISESKSNEDESASIASLPNSTIARMDDTNTTKDCDIETVPSQSLPVISKESTDRVSREDVSIGNNKPASETVPSQSLPVVSSESTDRVSQKEDVSIGNNKLASESQIESHKDSTADETKVVSDVTDDCVAKKSETLDDKELKDNKIDAASVKSVNDEVVVAAVEEDEGRTLRRSTRQNRGQRQSVPYNGITVTPTKGRVTKRGFDEKDRHGDDTNESESQYTEESRDAPAAKRVKSAQVRKKTTHSGKKSTPTKTPPKGSRKLSPKKRKGAKDDDDDTSSSSSSESESSSDEDERSRNKVSSAKKAHKKGGKGSAHKNRGSISSEDEYGRPVGVLKSIRAKQKTTNIQSVQQKKRKKIDSDTCSSARNTPTKGHSKRSHHKHSEPVLSKKEQSKLSKSSRKRKTNGWDPKRRHDNKAFMTESTTEESSVSESDDEESDFSSLKPCSSDFSIATEDDDEGDIDYLPSGRNARRAEARKVSLLSTSETEEVVNDDTPCCKCFRYDQPQWILLCDKCEAGYHTACLRPPLMIIPEGDWYCPPCEHKMLIEKLAENLKELDKELKEKARLDKRKERLAFVGISLDNIIITKEEQKENDRLKNGDDDDTRSETDDYNADDIDDSSGYDHHRRHRKKHGHKSKKSLSKHFPKLEPRACRKRAMVTYKFDEFDEMIASAIGDDVMDDKDDDVDEEGDGEEEEESGKGRGKDMANITGANEDEDEEGKPLPVRKSVQVNRKRRRLTQLDGESNEDDSEEYRASEDSDTEGSHVKAKSDSDDDDDESDYSDDDDSDNWRPGSRKKSTKKRGKGSASKSKRQSARQQRRSRKYDRDFVVDESEESGDSDVCRRRSTRAGTKKRVSYREMISDMEDEDEEEMSETTEEDDDLNLSSDDSTPKAKRKAPTKSGKELAFERQALAQEREKQEQERLAKEKEKKHQRKRVITYSDSDNEDASEAKQKDGEEKTAAAAEGGDDDGSKEPPPEKEKHLIYLPKKKRKGAAVSAKPDAGNDSDKSSDKSPLRRETTARRASAQCIDFKAMLSSESSTEEDKQDDVPVFKKKYVLRDDEDDDNADAKVAGKEETTDEIKGGEKQEPCDGIKEENQVDQPEGAEARKTKKAGREKGTRSKTEKRKTLKKKSAADGNNANHGATMKTEPENIPDASGNKMDEGGFRQNRDDRNEGQVPPIHPLPPSMPGGPPHGAHPGQGPPYGQYPPHQYPHPNYLQHPQPRMPDGTPIPAYNMPPGAPPRGADIQSMSSYSHPQMVRGAPMFLPNGHGPAPPHPNFVPPGGARQYPPNMPGHHPGHPQGYSYGPGGPRGAPPGPPPQNQYPPYYHPSQGPPGNVPSQPAPGGPHPRPPPSSRFSHPVGFHPGPPHQPYAPHPNASHPHPDAPHPHPDVPPHSSAQSGPAPPSPHSSVPPPQYYSQSPGPHGPPAQPGPPHPPSSSPGYPPHSQSGPGPHPSLSPAPHPGHMGSPQHSHPYRSPSHPSGPYDMGGQSHIRGNPNMPHPSLPPPHSSHPPPPPTTSLSSSLSEQEPQKQYTELMPASQNVRRMSSAAIAAASAASASSPSNNGEGNSSTTSTGGSSFMIDNLLQPPKQFGEEGYDDDMADVTDLVSYVTQDHI